MTWKIYGDTEHIHDDDLDIPDEVQFKNDFDFSNEKEFNEIFRLVWFHRMSKS